MQKFALNPVYQNLCGAKAHRELHRVNKRFRATDIDINPVCRNLPNIAAQRQAFCPLNDPVKIAVHAHGAFDAQMD